MWRMGGASISLRRRRSGRKCAIDNFDAPNRFAGQAESIKNQPSLNQRNRDYTIIQYIALESKNRITSKKVDDSGSAWWSVGWRPVDRGWGAHARRNMRHL
jgi:hypothetical protein